MAVTNRALILIASIACLASLTHAIAGQATYYDPPYFPSLCVDKKDPNTMVVAVNPSLFSNKRACGKKYRVRCIGGTNANFPHPCKGKTVDLTVVDLCPGCEPDHIDLSKEAFAMIADLDALIIKIDYHEI